MLVCVDGSNAPGGKGAKLLALPLDKCKRCVEKKRYYAYYNAATQYASLFLPFRGLSRVNVCFSLRRVHFFKNVDGASGERRVYGRVFDLPMEELKKYWIQRVHEDENGNLLLDALGIPLSGNIDGMTP